MGFFQHLFCRKPQKIEGGPFGGKKLKEVAQCRKKLTGGPFSLARYCMLLGKKGKTFLVQLPGPRGTI